MGKITVIFELHTILRRQIPEGRFSRIKREFDRELSIEEALKELMIDLDPEQTLIVVNQQNVNLEYQLQDGDIVNLIPAIAGGN